MVKKQFVVLKRKFNPRETMVDLAATNNFLTFSQHTFELLQFLKGESVSPLIRPLRDVKIIFKRNELATVKAEG